MEISDILRRENNMTNDDDNFNFSNMIPPEKFTFSIPSNWPQWRKRFERFMSISGFDSKSNDEKINMLVYVMGEDAEDILRQLEHSPETYAEALELFDRHFIPKRNVILERYKFNTRQQMQGESVVTFITDLLVLSEHCNYGILTDELIRDRIIVGMSDKKTSETLLFQRNLTLDEAIIAARQAEAQETKGEGTLQQEHDEKEANGNDLSSQGYETTVQSEMETAPPSEAPTKTSGNCQFCGQPDHPWMECRAKNTTCTNCGKKGHSKTACHFVKRTNKEVICFTCNKRIEGQVLTALDKTYHPEHFVCEKCKKPICDNKFRTHDGRAYCEEDYNRLFVAHCFGCGDAISGKFISALGHDWHEEHFLCNWCKSKLVGQTFMEHQGKPICQRCFKDNIASKCKRCGEGILEKVIKALDNTWHPDCFQCAKCKQPITVKVFSVTQDNEPVCEKCS